MFGASVSELYLLIKALINIERTVDLCVITKKNQKETHVHRNCESGLVRSNINASIQTELRVTVPLNNAERKEVEHIKSKNRTHNDRVLGTILLHRESFR